MLLSVENSCGNQLSLSRSRTSHGSTEFGRTSMSGSPYVANTLMVSAGIATLIPGIDGDAVVGAFAGAVFFVVFSRDITAWGKLGYLFASWVFGYFFANEIVARAWTTSSGLVAFLGGLFCVVVCVSLLEWVQGGKTPGWLKFIIERIGGRNG